MNSKISDKDKKDWENFLSDNESLPNKDSALKKSSNKSTDTFDLHGYTLDDANKKIKELEKLTKGKIKAATIDILFKNSDNANELKDGLERICFEAKSLIFEANSGFFRSKIRSKTPKTEPQNSEIHKKSIQNPLRIQ